MLRMTPFELLQPTSFLLAIEALQRATPPVRVAAGGTDLLPALKTGKTTAATVVSLGRIAEGDTIVVGADGSARIGALATLDAVATHTALRMAFPAVAAAAGHAASPAIRRRATLGGNLLLDVRCRYVDQSALFRHALGGCLKSHGAECHVVPGGRSCVAALAADTVAPLVAAGALVELLGPDGARSLPLAELYDADGRTPHRLRPHELVVAVQLPPPPPGTRACYGRWALRKAIDFPLVSVAIVAQLRRDSPDAAPTLAGGTVVVTALGPQPRVTPLEAFAGRALDDAVIAEVVSVVRRRSRPLPNLPFDEQWRHRRLAVEVRRMLAALRG